MKPTPKGKVFCKCRQERDSVPLGLPVNILGGFASLRLSFSIYSLKEEGVLTNQWYCVTVKVRLGTAGDRKDNTILLSHKAQGSEVEGKKKDSPGHPVEAILRWRGAVIRYPKLVT